ncbi:MAG: RHS repeat-associated core domain-containing protein, partial [Pseudomonadota bacterium]
VDGSAHAYTTNNLNQYTQTTRYPGLNVTGLAPAAAAVTVNGAASGITRHGDYYFQGFAAANASAPVWQSLAIASSYGGSSTRYSFLPLSPEPFSYDLDGNLLSDGRWDYAYDAENRLVAMQPRPAVLGPIPNADARRIEFKHDHLGRRVQKTVRAGWNGAAYTTVVSDTKSLYNGWNLVAELNADSLQLKATYVWGLDWSGTFQGAGGVGGLLYQNDLAGGATMIPAYDGNGNVMALLKRSDSSGSVVAAYEYDAFGQTLAAYGSHAAANPFRFSTKYTDTETGLLYYGLRYYSPTLGRFVNRDPIEEQGGHNLYAFVSNNGVNKWDYLGMNEDNPYMPNNTGGGWFAGIYYNQEAWNQFLANVINKPGYFDGSSSVSVAGNLTPVPQGSGPAPYVSPNWDPTDASIYQQFSSGTGIYAPQPSVSSAQAILAAAGYSVTTGKSNGRDVSLTIADPDGNVVVAVSNAPN